MSGSLVVVIDIGIGNVRQARLCYILNKKLEGLSRYLKVVILIHFTYCVIKLNFNKWAFFPAYKSMQNIATYLKLCTELEFLFLFLGCNVATIP